MSFRRWSWTLVLAVSLLVAGFGGSEDTIRFAVIGDYGVVRQSTEDVANLIKSWNPDFIITTGDNNYQEGAASTIDENIGQFFHSFIYPYKGIYGPGATNNRFFPSLGNHDWGTDNAAPYIEYFSLPGNESYYDFRWGPVHFFAINSNQGEPDGTSSTSIQAQWLKGRLASSTAPFRFVYMHHPPYSSGGRRGSTPSMQWPYKEWGADAVFAGHDHIYERINFNGLLYFLSGLGGESRSPLSSPEIGSKVRYNNDYGAMLVDVSNSRAIFKFITRTGLIIDSYTIYKGVQGVDIDIKPGINPP